MPATDQDEVLAFLEGGGLGCRAERIDTHAAIVLLAGDRAFKLKRPVRYSFLDFTTLERREAALRHELELNRRTRPSSTTASCRSPREPDGGLALDGAGQPVEWLLEMRRFPAEAELDRVAAAGGLHRRPGRPPGGGRGRLPRRGRAPPRQGRHRRHARGGRGQPRGPRRRRPRRLRRRGRRRPRRRDRDRAGPPRRRSWSAAAPPAWCATATATCTSPTSSCSTAARSCSTASSSTTTSPASTCSTTWPSCSWT